jgi:SSS family solute:Na+ symporter
VLETVIAALTIFYSLLVVTLFVPILGGLYAPRAGSAAALTAIAAGVVTMFVARFASAAAYRWIDPTLAGLAAAAVAFTVVAGARQRR